MEEELLRRQLLIMLLCVALTLVAFGLANAAGNQTINVPGDYATIQGAIDACDNDSAVDTILVKNTGTPYYENIEFESTGGYKYIVLEGLTKYGAAPVIDGGGADSVIKILESSQDITVRNFKITNGLASKGGGIFVGDETAEPALIPGIKFEDLEITKNRATLNGGGVYANYAKTTMDQCCIHKNDAGTSGGGLYLSWPAGGDYTLGYSLLDCVVFHNHAEVNGGGIFMNQDNNYSMIFNCLIRQNLNGTANGGAGIHYNCADGYLKNCTIADNYYDVNVSFGDSDYGDTWTGWSGVPLWGQNPAVDDNWTAVYGVYSTECSGCWLRLIHNIIYYNGPPGTDDVEDDIDASNSNNEIEAWYCDIQMGGAGTYSAGSSLKNMDADPLFVKSDDFGSYACNSTLYFLDKNTPSPCVNAGILDDDDDPASWGTKAGVHCRLVNTKSKGKSPRYSVHRDGSEDIDHFCDGYGGVNEDDPRVDLGFHYKMYGPSYIELASFTAEVRADKVVVKWETATEIDNAGFLVYRCDNEASDCHRVSNFIAADGDAVGGATYSFTDTSVAAGGGYYYYLVDIDTSGEWTAHGPVFARIPNIVEPILRLPKLEALIR